MSDSCCRGDPIKVFGYERHCDWLHTARDRRFVGNVHHSGRTVLGEGNTACWPTPLPDQLGRAGGRFR